MKRLKNLTIGGIQNKIFNLILITVGLITAAFIAVSVYQTNATSKIVAENSEKQQETISDTTSLIMDAVVLQTLERSNKTEIKIASEMFDDAANRVAFLADEATRLLANADKYPPRSYAGPNPTDDGIWTANVIFADGTNPANPDIVKKLGLMANLFDSMISLCPSFGASKIYIGLPEGAHISASKVSSSWFENGKLRSYDPRTRDWYQRAVDAGGLIFTDGEWDFPTGSYCIECAKPVYGPDGSLQAVVGTDLFLNDMQKTMQETTVEGESYLLINQQGQVVLSPQENAFPMDEADRDGDIRESKISLLAQVATEALEGKNTGVLQGELADGPYYIVASPIESTGWVLISAYKKELTERPGILLQENLSEIQARSQEVYREKAGYSKKTALVLLLLVTLLTLLASLILGKRISGPLTSITKKISKLSGENLEFKMEDSYRTGDEVEELAQSFAELSHKTVTYMDEVVRVTAEKERIGTELSLATDIQAAMLPHIFPAFPNRPEFDIYASMDPAKEVGGDFYDYFLVDENRLCMLIADVSGKGVPAALFMMASKIILQSVAMLGSSPAEILAKTNEALCSNNEAEMFVTVWLGILDITSGKVVAANAGHEYPVLKDPDGSYELYKDKHGFVLGAMPGMKYKEYEFTLKPGSKIFVYTDGVPEATDANNELFGTERMVAALNEKPDAKPEEVLNNMRDAVNRFVKDAEQFDDLTMLCLEYTGK